MNCSLSRHAARILLSASATFLLGTGAAQAQTEFSAGGVEVRAFLARTSPANTVYAAGYGSGLFRSTDAGLNWTRLSLPNNERYLTSLAGNTTTTIVVGGEEGLLTSTDGTTFTRRLNEPVTAVAMGTGGSGNVIAAIRGLGIVWSNNSGVSFSAADNGDFLGTDIIALAESPTSASTFYAAVKPDGQGNRGGVYKTTDGGQNWSITSAIETPSTNNLQVFGLAVDSSGSVYAAMFRLQGGMGPGTGGVYKLTGGVGAWSGPLGNTFGEVTVHRDANTPANIWAGSLRLGITRQVGGAGNFDYQHSDGGNPNFFYTSVTTISTVPGTTVTLKALKGAGVWRATSIAGGATAWNRVVFPGADRVLSASGVAGNASTMLLGLHAGGVWRSNAAGNAPSTFNPPTVNAGQADFSFAAGATAVNAFVSIWDIAASTTDPNWIYVAAGNVGMHYANDNSGLFRFNGTAWQGIRTSGGNSGAPWNIIQESGVLPLALPGNAVYGVAILKGDDNVTWTGWLANTGALIRRVAGGTWSVIATPGITPQIRSIVNAAAPNQNRVIALPFDDKPVFSTDYGATWTQSSVGQTGFERLRFFAVAENPTNPSNWIGASNKGVFVSNNAGQSWSRVGVAFTNQAFTAVGFKSTGRAFIADFGGNRYCSANGGSTWSSAGATLRAGVNAIRVFNGQLYYLTDGAGAQREDGTC